MAYFTYRLLKDVPLEQLKRKVEANLALYEPGTVGRQITVELAQGHGCSGMVLGIHNHEEEVLRLLGYQFGGIWMDVRFQDHDTWDLMIAEGPEHRVSHDVNPWAFRPRVEYNQDHVDFRINRVCELWPDHAERIRRYLLPWRVPIIKEGRTRFVRRKGKAYESDRYGFGDANQIYDFIQAFGIGPGSPIVTIRPEP